MSPKKTVKRLLECIIELFMKKLVKRIENSKSDLNLIENCKEDFYHFVKRNRELRSELCRDLTVGIRLILSLGTLISI